MWAFQYLRIILSFTHRMRDTYLLWMSCTRNWLRKTTLQDWEERLQIAQRQGPWSVMDNITCGKRLTSNSATTLITMQNKRDFTHRWIGNKASLESTLVRFLKISFKDFKTRRSYRSSSNNLNLSNNSPNSHLLPMRIRLKLQRTKEWSDHRISQEKVLTSK